MASLTNAQVKCSREGCNASASKATGLCPWHDPKSSRNTKKQDVEGYVSAADLPVQSVTNLDDALKLGQWLAIALPTGQIDTKTGMALVSTLREFRNLYVQAELAQRIKDLESRIAAAKARGVEV